jgi:hypothetical protein
MARSFGSEFAGQLDSSIKGPLDSKSVTPFKTDLVEPSTWVTPGKTLSNANCRAYDGMLVTVYGDTEENNGLYQLKPRPSTLGAFPPSPNVFTWSQNPDNWIKLGGGNEDIITGDEGHLVLENSEQIPQNLADGTIIFLTDE